MRLQNPSTDGQKGAALAMDASQSNGKEIPAPRVIALVIGIDDYAKKPLSGCVNDALAMRRLLLDKFGASPEEVVTLLAPRGDVTDLPKFGPATAANLRFELARLRTRANAGDRVFIYYSGHGGSQRLVGKYPRQVESLVPQDGAVPGNLIYDNQLNASLASLVDVTPHLTVILDCCHSAGATRTVTAPDGGSTGDPETRFIKLAELSAQEALDHFQTPLVAPRAECLTIAACSADEVSLERTFPDGSRHGAFTRGLLATLDRLVPARLETTAWRDIWSSLTAATAPAQHPQVIGDDTRPLAGSVTPLLAGDLLVEKQPDGYEVHAGTMVDITPGTLIRVCGVVRAANGTVSEQTCGVLRVSQADARRALAEPVGTLDWPAIQRFRIEKLGGPVLTFSMRPQGAQAPKEVLAQLLEGCSSVVQVEQAAEVEVVQDGNDWVVCDELFGLASDGRPELGRFNLGALREVLEHTVRYRAPARVAQRARDLSGHLKLRLLDTTGITSPNAVTHLAEIAPMEGICRVGAGMTFCLELVNDSSLTLHTTLLNMAPSGYVQALDHVTLAPTSTQRVWLNGVIGNSFYLTGSGGFERTFALATTDPAINFRHLALARSYRSVIGEAGRRGTDETSRAMGEEEDASRGGRGAGVVWTHAKVIVQSI